MYEIWISWVYTLNNVELALCFILSMMGTGFIALAIFHRFFERRFHLGLETNEAISFFGQSVGVAYGILIGLTAVACWDNYEETQRIISQETGSIGQLHRLSYGLSSDTDSIRELSLKYLDLIVSDEMPLLSSGLTCNAALEALKDLREELFHIQLKTKRDDTVFSTMLSAYDEMVGLRQERVSRALDYAVPSVFWVVIFLGGVVILGMICFVHMPSLAARYILMSSYCTVMGLMYFLIVAIDHPFKGEIRVNSEPYRQLHIELKNGM